MTWPTSVKVARYGSDYPVFEIDHPAARARVSSHGAQVLEWVPAGGDGTAVLYLSPDAVFQTGKAIRGGIPLCWPWFNAHPTNRALPSHGFARTRHWKLLEISEDESGVTMLMEIQSDERTRELWPFDFRLRAAIDIGRVLRVRLETMNIGESVFEITEALHAYLAVRDVERTELFGLDGVEYIDTVEGRKRRLQKGRLLITEEVDRIYESDASVRVGIGDPGRFVVLEKAGSACTTVWNPWKDKARALSDLPDEDYRRFVCVEPANAGDRVVSVAPGESHHIESVIWVDESCM